MLSKYSIHVLTLSYGAKQFDPTETVKVIAVLLKAMHILQAASCFAKAKQPACPDTAAYSNGTPQFGQPQTEQLTWVASELLNEDAMLQRQHIGWREEVVFRCPALLF